jgi:uncharacterized membrane protein
MKPMSESRLLKRVVADTITLTVLQWHPKQLHRKWIMFGFCCRRWRLFRINCEERPHKLLRVANNIPFLLLVLFMVLLQVLLVLLLLLLVLLILLVALL